MIPKIIHYCWFGGHPLPKSAIKCIESWKKFFPDYEIKEWNEDNFDVNQIPYTEQAYKAGKYAFVSDYARFKILYEYGGIYFDTDVEVIKSFDDIIEKGPFMGLESNDPILINPGLGIGALPKMSIYKELIEEYSKKDFTKNDGSLDLTTIVSITTELFKRKTIKKSSEILFTDGISIYPQKYFNPFDDITGKLIISDETHSIHWYSKTWIETNKFRTSISRFSHRTLGLNFSNKIKNLLKIK